MLVSPALRRKVRSRLAWPKLLFRSSCNRELPENVCLLEPSVKRLDHLKNLVIMAAADGSLSEQEIALLVDRSSALGLEEEDLEKAIAFALSGDAKLTFPIDRAEQNQMLADLIRMMAADGKLSEVEKRLFALAAAKMGIEKAELDSLIDQLVRRAGEM